MTAICSLISCENESVQINIFHSFNSIINSKLKNYAKKFERNVLERDGKNIDVSFSYSENEDFLFTNTAILNRSRNLPSLVFGSKDLISRFYNEPALKEVIYNFDSFYETEDKIKRDDFVEEFVKDSSNYLTKSAISVPFLASSYLMYYGSNIIGKTINGINSDSAIDEEYMNSLNENSFLDLIKAIAKEPGQSYKSILTFESSSHLFKQHSLLNHLDLYKEKDNKVSLLFNTVEHKKMVEEFNTLHDDSLLTVCDVEGYKNPSTFLNEGKTLFYIGSSLRSSSMNIKEAQCKVTNSPFDKNGLLFDVLGATGFNNSKFDDEKDFIAKENDKEKYAKEFLSYILGDETQAIIGTNTTYLPVNKKAYETELYKRFLSNSNVVSDSMNLLIKNQANFKSQISFKGKEVVDGQLGYIITSTFKDEKTIDKAFKDAFSISVHSI